MFDNLAAPAERREDKNEHLYIQKKWRQPRRTCPSESEQIDLLATREESAGLWHLFPTLTVGTDTPSHGSNTKDCCAHDGRVQSPVRGLSVPASGGRPDFLGVSAYRLVTTHEDQTGARRTYGILPPPPMLIGLNRTFERGRRWQWLAEKALVLGGMKPKGPSTFLPDARDARARSGLAARASHTTARPRDFYRCSTFLQRPKVPTRFTPRTSQPATPWAIILVSLLYRQSASRLPFHLSRCPDEEGAAPAMEQFGPPNAAGSDWWPPAATPCLRSSTPIDDWIFRCAGRG